MVGLPAGRLNRRIRIERPQAKSGFVGAGSGDWEQVTTVAAEVQDVLPSRGEKVADGVTISSRPARVRMRFRRDITPSMRFVLLLWDSATAAWVTDRIMQIVAGPAELGRRDGLEFMAEDWSPAGNPA